VGGGKMNEEIKKILEHQSYAETKFPDLLLYMDQVLEFLNSNFRSYLQDEEDKIFTKTMINNYVKAKLLPPPEKKKYRKDHIMTLIFLYYCKQTLSIQDTKEYLDILTISNDSDKKNLEKNYIKFLEIEKKVMSDTESQLKNFDNKSKEEQEKVISGFIIEAAVKQKIVEVYIKQYNQE
jgi:hypothetical protein